MQKGVPDASSSFPKTKDVTTWHADVATNSATFVAVNTKIANAQEIMLNEKLLNEKQLSEIIKLNE